MKQKIQTLAQKARVFLEVLGLAVLLTCVAGAASTDLWRAGNTKRDYGRILSNGQFLTYGGYAMGRQVINATNTTTIVGPSAPIIALVNITGNTTVTLPKSQPAGTVFIIKDEIGGINVTGNLTVNVTSAGNIDNVDSVPYNTTKGYVRYYSNGTNYFSF